MDKYFFNDNLSIKLNIVCNASINNNFKIDNDPIPSLIKDLSEIRIFDEMKNLTKILYFNYKKIHQILYQFDEIIQIQDSSINDLSFNFYLILLIRTEAEIINYQCSINYINIFNKLKNNEENIYYNIINSKIIIELLNNLKNSDLFNEDKDGECVSNLENENREYIEKNLNIFKEINLNLNENDILEKNVDELYIDIINALIKNDKISDFDFSYNIFRQLDLEKIDLPFMESENLLKSMLETLNLNNENITKYMINNFDDMNDIKKINFHYMLLKFILKSSIYIYHIPLLFQAHKKMVEIIKTEEYFNFTMTNQIIIERIEYVIKKLCDLDFYFYTKYLSKKNTNNKSENSLYIKSNLLKKSTCIFNISIETNKNPQVNKIESIYENDKNINFEDMVKLYDKNNEYENKLELNINYLLFLNILNSFKNIIESQISIFEFNYNFKLIFEFTNSNIKNNNIYVLNVTYTVSDHPFYKMPLKSSDENILEKKENELVGFNFLMNKLNLEEDKNETSTKIQTKIYSSITQELSSIDVSSIVEKNNKKSPSIFTSIFNESEYKIIYFEKLIYKHEDIVKFFLCLKDGYYFSCGDNKNMILYDQNFKKLLTIYSLEDQSLYYISEKISGNENIIELIACYGKNIYLITINKTDYKYKTKKYQIPKVKVLFCMQIFNSYAIAGINSVMIVEDLFNDNLNTKKMFKISSESFKNGLIINNNYIALTSNNLIPNGTCQLVICNLNNFKIEYSLSDFSFNLNESSIALIKLTNNNFLLCACKKYNRNQANGILIVNLNVLEGETMEYKFYDTGNFEVYCFCQIFGNSAFIFVGGFDLNKRRGIIKIFKVKDENETEIQFLQDIENIEDNNDSPLFDLPVNNIIQTKDSGKIIITTIDGKIYLFSKPNLDFYFKRPKG